MFHFFYQPRVQFILRILGGALLACLLWNARVHAGSSDYEPGGRYDYGDSGRSSQPFSKPRSSEPPSYSGPSYQRPNIDQQQLEQDLKRYGTPDGKGGYHNDYRQSNQDQRQLEIDQKRYGNY